MNTSKVGSESKISRLIQYILFSLTGGGRSPPQQISSRENTNSPAASTETTAGREETGHTT